MRVIYHRSRMTANKQNKHTFKISGVSLILWIWHKRRLHILYIVPVNCLEEWHLLHFFIRWPDIWIHGQQLFHCLNGFQWKCFIVLRIFNIWKGQIVWINTVELCEIAKLANSLLLKIFSKTFWGVSSLNGGTPVMNSYKHTPSDHQSTAGPWLCLREMSIILVEM